MRFLRFTQNSVAQLSLLLWDVSFSAVIEKHVLPDVLYKLTFNSRTVLLVAMTHHISGSSVMHAFSWSGFCNHELLPIIAGENPVA
jgi:hypothetical protein